MLERRSALASAKPYKSNVLEIGEVRGFTLTQAAGLDAGLEKRLASTLGELPPKAGIVKEHSGRIVMRIGPSQFWIIGPETENIGQHLEGRCAVTPLSNSRTRIFTEGAPARDVLAKGVPLDFHPAVFRPGMFAMTGLHHTPVTVHCVSENRFELYVMRTFALNLWEWLSDAALEYC